MLIICLCIWMLRTLLLYPMVGANMHNLVCPWSIKVNGKLATRKGRNCQGVWDTSAISTFLVVGKVPKSYIPAKSPTHTSRESSILSWFTLVECMVDIIMLIYGQHFLISGSNLMTSV